MNTDHDSFPFVTMTFIFIIFINFVSPVFGAEMGIAVMVVLFWEFLVLAIIIPFMAYHKRDLPLIIIPFTISLLWIGVPVFVGGEGMIQINLPDAAVMTIIGGVIIAVIGGVTTAVGALWKIWRDSKAIEDIKKTVDKVDTHVGEAKGEVVSVREKEISTIESHTSDIHENMLLKVLPGMEKLDSISGFVTRIDINTQNSGGDIKLIFSEVNKMVERIESLKYELETEKRESREREQEYMGQIAVLRAENSQLKGRNRKLELALGRRDRDQDIER